MEALPGVTVHPADEVLASFITHANGQLSLRTSDGTQIELAATPAELGGNVGDGAFHPMPVDEVVAALRALRFPSTGQHFEIFILPYARLDYPMSIAVGNTLFLAPGVREYSADDVHFVASHEFGHLVQAAVMPDENLALWATYRQLRGITDEGTYNAAAVHADRPHEIFAEDFRFLFGDAEANYTGGIENQNLALPTANPAVKAFFLGLVQTRVAALRPQFELVAGPNPFLSSSVLTFTLASSYSSASGSYEAAATASQAPPTQLVRLEVFSTDGRRVRQLVAGQYAPGSYRAVFDGRDDAGRPLARGVFFARLTVGSQATTQKLLLAR